MNNIPFHIIIPARYQSTRFPGKLLKEINGLSIIQRVYQQACLTSAQSITIATDHELIAEHAKQFGADVQMTASTHQSGTDRIAEVVARNGFTADSIIVNVQGDEPFIEPQLIQQVVRSLSTTLAPMSTLCWPIDSLEQLNNPNVVKVVRSRDNFGLYFSRSPIPAHRDHPNSWAHCFRHIGLFAYRSSFLLDFVNCPPCELEQSEMLEQLRALWSGALIKVETACVEPKQDINTKDDLILAQALMEKVQ